MKLFVYGTLCKSKKLNYIMNYATFLGSFKTVEQFYMFGLKSGAYPLITDVQINPSCEKAHILGELYEVSDIMLEKIDQIEGHPDYYTRTPIKITDGTTVQEADGYILLNEKVKEEIAANFEVRFQALNGGIWTS